MVRLITWLKTLNKQIIKLKQLIVVKVHATMGAVVLEWLNIDHIVFNMDLG